MISTANENKYFAATATDHCHYCSTKEFSLVKDILFKLYLSTDGTNYDKSDLESIIHLGT